MELGKIPAPEYCWMPERIETKSSTVGLRDLRVAEMRP
jgi:hypothetical protein